MPPKADLESPWREGSLLHYAKDWKPYLPDEWRTGWEWSGYLYLNSMERGRSAKYTVWEDEQGHSYPMFIVDLMKLIQDHHVIKFGRCAATWRARKRGKNYGVYAHGPR